jgi:hypothetical protein
LDIKWIPAPVLSNAEVFAGMTGLIMIIKQAREIAEKHSSEKIVLVASRRTDMPRFHTEEIINGLKTGAFHPQGLMHEMWRLEFKPENIHSVGLWSQDFSSWISERKKIAGYGYKFWYRFTILPDNPVCKPKAPQVSEQLLQLEKLCEQDGPETVSVFVDPLMRYSKIGKKEWNYNFSAESLLPILKKLKETGISSLSLSIIDYYGKVKKRAERYGVEFFYPDDKTEEGQIEIINMMRVFHEAADIYGITIKTCCEKFISESGFSESGSCVDGKKLNRIFGPGASIKTDSGQRKKFGCGCTCSVDIGRYIEYGEWSHHCGHDCPQCYARK